MYGTNGSVPRRAYRLSLLTLVSSPSTALLVPRPLVLLAAREPGPYSPVLPTTLIPLSCSFFILSPFHSRWPLAGLTGGLQLKIIVTVFTTGRKQETRAVAPDFPVRGDASCRRRHSTPMRRQMYSVVTRRG